MINGIGRPSSYREEIGNEICLRLSAGESLQRICREKDMPARQTVVQWTLSTENLAFANNYARARAAYADTLFDEIIEIADDTSGDWVVRDGVRVYNGEAVGRSRVRIDSRKWVVARINPTKYGDKIEVQDMTPLTDAPPDLTMMARKIALAFRLAAMKEIEHADGSNAKVK